MTKWHIIAIDGPYGGFNNEGNIEGTLDNECIGNLQTVTNSGVELTNDQEDFGS